VTKRRRTPLGTQPPAAPAEPPKQVSGTIECTPAVERAPIDADQEHTVIVQIDDDWLERLDRPRD